MTMFKFFCYALQAILSLAQNDKKVDFYHNSTLQAACLLCANAPAQFVLNFLKNSKNSQILINFLNLALDKHLV